MGSLKEFANKLQSNTYLRAQVVLALDIFISLLGSLGVFSVLFIIMPQLALDTETVLTWIIGSAVASAFSFVFFRVYRAIIRYSTLRETGRICMAVAGKEFLL